MGMPPFSGRCRTNYSPVAVPPNPDPSRWKKLDARIFQNAYVVKVKYSDCTNFEGVKVLVFKGQFVPLPEYLDPHFADNDRSPIARFKPDEDGWEMALEFARSL